MSNRIGISKNESFLNESDKDPLGFLVLNCRGFKFEILKKKLKEYPSNSKLAQLLTTTKEQEVLLTNENEYYFDQDPFILNLILNYNKTTNKLHIHSNDCVKHLQNEFNFWFNQEPYEEMFDLCCKIKFNKELDLIQDEIKFESNVLKKYYQLNKKIDYGQLMPKIREKIWILINKPISSYGAIALFTFSQLTLILSTINLIMNSVFNNYDKNVAYNSTQINTPYNYYPSFLKSQYVFMGLFTFEIIFTFIICPFKKKFFCDFFNFLNLMTLIPFYLNLIIDATTVEENLIGVISYVTEMIRIALLFRVTKLSVHLQSLGVTIKNSFRELFVLILYLVITILIFSSIIFYSEKISRGTESEFKSIPGAFWWAIITMTTVGYGDLVPKSVLGKCFASIAALSGILIIAMPVAVIGSNFVDYYKNEQKKQLILKINNLKE